MTGLLGRQSSAQSFGGPGALILLAVLVVLAYWNSLDNGFALDDQRMIEENPLITRAVYLPTLLTSDYWAGFRDSAAAHSVQSGLYRPLVLLSFAANYAFGGLDFYYFHLVNVLLHLLASWLVYLVARQLGIEDRGALVGAVVFALHPIHTEAVSNVVGRSELLMAVGVLASLRWALQGRTAIAVAAFLLGLLSKEQALVLPFLLLLGDFTLGSPRSIPEGGSLTLGYPVRRYAPFFVLLAGYAVLRTIVLGRLSAPTSAFLENPLPSLEWYPRLLTTISVAGQYLSLFFWPRALSADYSYNSVPFAHSPLDPGVLVSVIAWSGLFGVSAWTYRRCPLVAFAVGFLLLTFLPTSNVLIPIGTIMGERLFYLPSAGLCLLVGLAYQWGANSAERGTMNDEPRTFRTSRVARRTQHLVPPIVLALLCLAMIWRTIDRNRDWINTESILLSVVRVHPNNAKAYSWLGDTAAERKDWKAAVEYYEEAFRIYPDYGTQDAGKTANLGLALLESGRDAEGLAKIERAVEMRPNWSLLRSIQGIAYTKTGQYDEAERAFIRARDLQPDSWQAHYGLSQIYLEQERYEAALHEAEATIAVKPNLMEPRYTRARALEALGRDQDAIEEYARVMRFSQAPGDVAERFYRLHAAGRGGTQGSPSAAEAAH